MNAIAWRVQLREELVPDPKGRSGFFPVSNNPQGLVSGLRKTRETVHVLLSMDSPITNIRGAKTYAVFRETATQRLRKFLKISKDEDTLIRAYNVLRHLPPQNFNEQLGSVQTTLAFAKDWAERPTIRLGSYRISHGNERHNEAPLDWRIYKPGLILPEDMACTPEDPLATLGFLLYRTKEGKTVARITNLQGGMPGIQEHIEELSAHLGENWRHRLVKMFHQLCLKKGWIPEGVNPKKSKQTDKQYRTNVKQYRAAYENAGWKEENGIWRPES